MKTKIFFLAAMLFVTTIGVCQSALHQQGSPARFSSINQIGLLTGGTGQAATVQSINGIKIGKWFTGIGVGVDYYGIRSVPLFIDVRRSLVNKKSSPFIYADGGINLPWKTNNVNTFNGFVGSTETGPLFEGGIGMKLQTKNIGAFIISAGYSYKKTTEKAELFDIWSSFVPLPSYEHYTYHYRRLVVKIGLQL